MLLVLCKEMVSNASGCQELGGRELSSVLHVPWHQPVGPAISVSQLRTGNLVSAMP